MKRIFEELIGKISRKNAGFIVGACFFLLALLVAIFGFWKTLCILLFTILGYIIGVKLFTDPDELRRLLDKLLPPGRFR